MTGKPPLALRRLVPAVLACSALATIAVVALTTYLVTARSVRGQAVDTAVRRFRVAIDAASNFDEPLARDALDSFVQLYSLDAELVLRYRDQTVQTSPALGESAVPDVVRQAAATGEIAHAPARAGGRSWVVVGGRVLPDGATLFAFQPLGPVDERLRQLRLVLVAATVVGGMAFLALGHAVGRWLAGPFAESAQAASAPWPDHSDGLPEDTRFEELNTLNHAVNERAAAVEAAERERRSVEARYRKFVLKCTHDVRHSAREIGLVLAAGDVSAARATSDHLVDMTESLYTYGLARAKDRVNAEDFHLDRLLRSVLERTGLSGGVSWDCPPGLEIHADPVHVSRVLQNLVTNAIEHGRPPVSVCATATNGGVVVIDVCDDGPGVPDLDVFDEEVSTKRTGGGLGLAIVQALVESMGGGVSATSGPGGRGARFSVTLPGPLNGSGPQA